MRYILAKRHAADLAAFASANVLTAFDYDGTLAPIAPDPASAPMRRRTRQLLGTLAQQYPCVVISGRRRSTSITALTVQPGTRNASLSAKASICSDGKHRKKATAPELGAPSRLTMA